jgi:hypothetical protein
MRRRRYSRCCTIAIALTLGIASAADTRASADADAADPPAPDFSFVATSADLGSDSGALDESWFVLTDTAPALPETQALALNAASIDEPPALTLRTEGAPPAAPLPPPLFLGALGIGMVAVASYRLKKRARL